MARIVLIGNIPESLMTFRRPLMEEMMCLGHEVLACAPPDSAIVPPQLRALGIHYQPIPLSRAGMNPIHDLQSLIAFIRLFRQVRPDLVLSYTIKPIVYGSIAASIAGVPRISSMITGLGSSFAEGKEGQRIVHHLACQLYRAGLKNNRVVFFQNPDDQQLFRSLGLVKDPVKSVLINGSGVDLEQFSTCPLPKRASFLLVARLIPEKGVREYYRAARLIRAKYPDVRFRLVGILDQKQGAIREDEVEMWKREGAIEYLGYLSDVRPVIADASVYVLPSYYREGTPRSTLEAMSMGRAVVTTDAPGCRETVIDGVNGFKVPIRDAEALAKVLERFIEEPDLIPRMGAESRKLAEDKFDVRKVNRVILEHLDLTRDTTLKSS